MKIRSCLFIILALLLGSILLAGCNPSPSTEPCTFTANEPLTAYRLPDDTSDVFGVISTGETYKVLAQTVEGWVGFDPGVAQAGNIGLAHHRWVLLNATLSSACLSSIDLVTLADVQADIDASSQ
jgi:hypothetical protein